MTSKSTNGANGKKPTVIVFGRDADDKPRAGVFIGKVADAARQAAGTLPVRVLDATTPDSQTLAAKTPPGRMQDDGKPFLPYVPRDLYDQIVTIASAQPQPQPQAPGATPPPAGNVSPAAKTAPGLPRTWDEIATGQVVIAQDDSADEGWWEAVVVDRKNDVLTLRWRDYPKYKAFTRHVAAIAMLNPTTK